MVCRNLDFACRKNPLIHSDLPQIGSKIGPPGNPALHQESDR